MSYAPSCQLLQQVQQRQRPDFQSLFAIQNPTEDLNYTNLEVESILSYFPSHQVLSKKQATKAALSQAATELKEANYLHFSCHGLTDFNNTSDEYIGLPSGFLYAGSSSVVSSFWTVNDLSTSFLMIKFIQILQDTTDMSVPLAMNQVQQWLRDVTKEELQEWVKKSFIS